MNSFPLSNADLIDAPKKKMSLSISEPLSVLAKQLDINLSRAAENGILQEVKRQSDAAWLKKNRAAMAAYNQRVGEEGLFADEVRNF